MKQFLLHLDETNAIGRKFVLQDLDDTHLFISSDSLDTLRNRIDDLMDKLHFPLQWHKWLIKSRLVYEAQWINLMCEWLYVI